MFNSTVQYQRIDLNFRRVIKFIPQHLKDTYCIDNEERYYTEVPFDVVNQIKDKLEQYSKSNGAWDYNSQYFSIQYVVNDNLNHNLIDEYNLFKNSVTKTINKKLLLLK